MKLLAALALGLLFAFTAIARAGPDVTAAGFWELRDSDDKPQAWFLFTQKDEIYSARLVKAFPKTDDPPPHPLCTACPGKKKGARIMGLTLFYDLKRDGLTYRNGSVIDPRDGSIYHALMDLSEDGQQLAVRGYLMTPMLGQTQLWRRLPDDAMKKEDIPKEILADDPPAAPPTPDKKPKKPKPAKAEDAQ